MVQNYRRKEEEEEEEEEVLYSCWMITVDIDFQECNVEITQDNRTCSNTIISTYNLVENRARLTVETRGLDWQRERLNMSSRLA